ncbi:hypothetical protein UlMin_008209 [Ulmus minor]
MPPPPPPRVGSIIWNIKPLDPSQLANQEPSNPCPTFTLDFHAELLCPCSPPTQNQVEEETYYNSCCRGRRFDVPYQIVMEEEKFEVAIDTMFAGDLCLPHLPFVIKDITKRVYSMINDSRSQSSSSSSNPKLGLFTFVRAFVPHLPPHLEDTDDDDDVVYDEEEIPGVDYDDDDEPLPASEEFIKGLPRQKVEDSDVVCSVCLEDVLKGSEAVALPCSHLYHGDCIIKWLHGSNVCPLCRFKMSS